MSVKVFLSAVTFVVNKADPEMSSQACMFQIIIIKQISGVDLVSCRLVQKAVVIGIHLRHGGVSVQKYRLRPMISQCAGRGYICFESSVGIGKEINCRFGRTLK